MKLWFRLRVVVYGVLLAVEEDEPDQPSKAWTRRRRAPRIIVVPKVSSKRGILGMV